MEKSKKGKLLIWTFFFSGLSLVAQQTRSFRRENERKCGTPRTWHYELVVQSMKICKSKSPPSYLRLLKTFRIWKVFFIGLPRESTVASMLCWHRLKSFQVMILSFNLLLWLVVDTESLSTTKIYYCASEIASFLCNLHPWRNWQIKECTEVGWEPLVHFR